MDSWADFRLQFRASFVNECTLEFLMRDWPAGFGCFMKKELFLSDLGLTLLPKGGVQGGIRRDLVVTGFVAFFSLACLAQLQAKTPKRQVKSDSAIINVTSAPTTTAKSDQELEGEIKAQQEAADAALAFESIMKMDAGQSVNQQLRQMVLRHLPERYIDDKKWNRTQEVKTLIPRSKPWVTKHGTWKKYEITPVAPDENLAIRLVQMRSGEDGVIRFTLECDSVLDLDVRQAKWVRGVQLYSLNIDATADFTIALACQLKLKFDLSKTPTLIVVPVIESTEITIHDFRIHRISKVGGELAQQVTRAVRDWLDSHAQENQRKITAAINKQIAKKQDKLQFPLVKK